MANYTILVIDYEPRSIEKLRVPLERAGYRVEAATDGQSGVSMFHTLEPAAVIIEAMLPKRHGFEVCQELKQTPHGATCPVMIATSVYRGHKYRHQAKHLYSCDAYLEKPLHDEDLLRTVEAALEHYEELRQKAAAKESIAMEIDTSNLAAEQPTKPAGATDTKEDFDISDRLDSLLSDDPSKSSPTRSKE